VRLFSAALLCLALFAASPAPAEPITSERVKSAVQAVRADPDLGGEKTVRRLRWKVEQDPEERDPQAAPPAPWLIELVRWLAESARVLIWVLGAAAVGVLLVFVWRWARVRADEAQGRAFVLPSHVRDLDIRPESLPDDIGGAARAMWLRGEQRAALSLLYRGALSRLVHGHAVPIRAASTEGECVQIASRSLSEPSSAFFAGLVGAWQIAVYGARAPEADSVLALCDQFDARLPAALPERAA